MTVKLTDNSIKVKSAMNDAAIAYLYEASGELLSQVVRNMDGLSGDWFQQQKGAWKYEVDESEMVSNIGSPLESSIWTEFGTGEYALHGDGRKGGWIYLDKKTGKFRKTFGQKPKRPLWKAYTSKKKALIKRAEEVIGGKMK